MRLSAKSGVISIFAAAVLLAPASAGAAMLKSNNFQAFDSRVSCGVQLKQIGGMSCHSRGIPAKDLDGFVELHSRGEAELGERGDSPWRPGKLRRLEGGTSWKRAGVTCHIAANKRPDVIKCLNLDRNGFLLGPNGYKLINPL